jgi:hypothetical protein
MDAILTASVLVEAGCGYTRSLVAPKPGGYDYVPSYCGASRSTQPAMDTDEDEDEDEEKDAHDSSVCLGDVHATLGLGCCKTHRPRSLSATPGIVSVLALTGHNKTLALVAGSLTEARRVEAAAVQLCMRILQSGRLSAPVLGSAVSTLLKNINVGLTFTPAGGGTALQQTLILRELVRRGAVPTRWAIANAVLPHRREYPELHRAITSLVDEELWNLHGKPLASVACAVMGCLGRNSRQKNFEVNIGGIVARFLM